MKLYIKSNFLKFIEFFTYAESYNIYREYVVGDIKALLFGLNYNGTQHRLNGCINDVYLMRDCLIKFAGVNEQNISILSDETIIKPNKINMIRELENAINIVNCYDSLNKLWIHYSGHGSYVIDYDNDESYKNDSHVVNGVDEVICPLGGGYISDDELNSLFGLLNKDKELICIFDCCHSGTALDLPYKYDYISDECKLLKNTNNRIKCNAILLSGCKDSQQSYDMAGLTNKANYTYSGAFTSSILKALQETSTTTLDELIGYTNDILRSKKLPQIPQISSSMEINPKTPFMESGIRQRAIQKIALYRRYCILCDYWFEHTLNNIYKSYNDPFTKEIQKLTII